MGDAPELHFAGADGDQRIDLAVDRDELVVADLGVLDQQIAFRQSAQQRIELFESIDHQCARHAAENLIVDVAVRVRVIPVEPRALPPRGRDAYFVLEALAGMHMHEDVVAVSPRRHTHAVIVQIRRRAGTRTKWTDVARIIGRRVIDQIVAERDPQRIAEARP
jgi:hypothetical protein